MKNTFTQASGITKALLILLCLCAAFSVAKAQVPAQTENEQLIKRIATLTTNIAAAPNNEDLYAERGMLNLRLEKYDEALADAQKALQINPKSTNALFVRGMAKGIKKDYDGAIADFSQTIAAFPDKATTAYLRRGEMYEEKCQYVKAIADYNKAAEIEPKATKVVSEALTRVKAEMKVVGKESEATQRDCDMTKRVIRTIGAAMSIDLTIRDSTAVNKMTELFIRKQDVSKKFDSFKTDFAKTSDSKQRLALLKRIRIEFQTALTEAESAEKQNSNFSAEQKNEIAKIKTFYSKFIKIADEDIASIK